MKAIRIHEDGGPEVLRYEDVADPVAGDGEVLIELRAASLNHLDVWIRKGLPSVPKPRILGADGAGVIAGTDERVVINPAIISNGTMHIVGETADGIIVRGARVLATLAPFADEQTVYPGQPIPADATQYAVAFAVPLDTPGLKFLCRDSASTPGADPFDKPLSSRFDEQDAFCIFDDATICMALVIWAVLLTDLMRRRMSRVLGIA